MALLAEELTTPIVAMLDGITAEDVSRLRDATARERRKAMDDPSERGTIARIVDIELRHERSIEVIGIPTRDIFDLLDEQVVRGLSMPGTRQQPFPGHIAARSAFARTAGKKTEAEYKKFLRDAYGVSVTASSVRKIALAMGAKGRDVPKPLDQVLDHVEEQARRSDESS
jgi:hypothetical protein